MKKLISLILAVCMVMCFASFAYADKLDDILAKGKISIGCNVAFAPYEFYYENPETGEEEYAGFEMSLAFGIGEMLGVEVEIVDQEFGGILTALSAGELDMAISGFSKKPERLEVVDFSDAYFTGTQILMIRAEDYDTLKTVEDMAGKGIGAQMGSLQQGILEEQFTESVQNVQPGIALMVQDLMVGNIDGLLLVDTVANQYIKAYPGMLAISEVPVVYDNSNGVGAAVQKGDNAALLEKVNAYIAQVLSDGTFDAWLDEAYAKAAEMLDAN